MNSIQSSIPLICQNFSELLGSMQYDAHVESKINNELVVNIPEMVKERLGVNRQKSRARVSQMNKAKVFEMLKRGHEEQGDAKFIRLIEFFGDFSKGGKKGLEAAG